MSSFLFGSLLEGVGKGMSVVGESGMRMEEGRRRREEEMEYRKELELERLRSRMILQDDAQAARTTVGGGTRSSSSTVAAPPEPGMLSGEETAAMGSGMSLPEYRAYIEGNKTGDFSAFKTEKTYRDSDPENSDRTSRMGSRKEVGFAPDFEATKQEALKRIADKAEEMRYGKDYKGVIEGRNDRKIGEYLDKSYKGDTQAGDAVLISKGKDPEVNEATEAEKRARAAKAGRGPAPKPESTSGAQTVVNSLKAQLLAAEKRATDSFGEDKARAMAEAADVRQRLRAAEDSLSKKPASSPSSAAPRSAASRSGTTAGGSTYTLKN